MKSINVAICDDDREILGVISGAIQSSMRSHGFSADVRTYTDGSVLLEAMKILKFQLILLDIEMPHLDGIRTGLKIRETEPELPIIFVSESESRVFDAFRAEPLCFVRKSHFLSDMAVATDLFRKVQERTENDYVECSARNGIVSISCRNILYIEGQRNYQIVHLADQKTEDLKMTMDQLEKMLLPKGFIRIHKGYIVNHSYVQRIDGLELQLRDGTVLPISRSRLEEVKTKYIRLM